MPVWQCSGHSHVQYIQCSFGYVDLECGMQARVKFHVLLTTYEMAVAEGTVLRSLQWEALVVDEGHRCNGNVAKCCVSMHSHSCHACAFRNKNIMSLHSVRQGCNAHHVEIVDMPGLPVWLWINQLFSNCNVLIMPQQA